MKFSLLFLLLLSVLLVPIWSCGSSSESNGQGPETTNPRPPTDDDNRERPPEDYDDDDGPPPTREDDTTGDSLYISGKTATTLLPALFDDFRYDRVEIGRAGTLFGVNTWITNVAEERTEQTRAWRRYNWGDLPFQYGSVSMTSDTSGVMLLTVPAGELDLKTARLPAVFSGFTLGAGTYAARVRFSDLPPTNNRLMSSFWAFTPDRYHFEGEGTTHVLTGETDFEWNNWFELRSGTRAARMHVTNHKGKKQISRAMDCQDAEDRIVRHCEGLFPNRWWLLKILVIPAEGGSHDEINADRVTYTMWSPETGDEDVRLWTGETTSLKAIRNTPISLSEHVPWKDMMAIFSLHWRPIEESLNLPQPITLEADWFYYSQEILTDEEVLQQVAGLRAVGPRVNTSGRPTFTDVDAGRTPHTVRVEGPNTLAEGETGTWTLQPSVNGTTYRITGYRWREQISATRNGPWQVVLELTFSAPMQGAGIEIEATVEDIYNRGEGRVQRITHRVERVR